MSIVPRLTTEQLILRRPVEQDWSRFRDLVCDDDAMRHVDGALTSPAARELFDAIHFPTTNDLRRVWVVCLCDADEYIGHAGLQLTEDGNSGELLFYLLNDYWNRGYATEIAARLVRYAFEDARLDAVTATVDPKHSASRRVLEKAGLSIHHWEQDDLGQFPVYSIQRNT